VINAGTVPSAIVVHYDWLQDFEYRNQPLLGFATSPWSEIGRSIQQEWEGQNLPLKNS